VNNLLPLITNVGVVGYGQFKVTEDSGSAVSPLVRGEKDRVFGLGGEVNVFIPQARLTVMARVLPEFGPPPHPRHNDLDFRRVRGEVVRRSPAMNDLGN
jgi:hypothetical protein